MLRIDSRLIVVAIAIALYGCGDGGSAQPEPVGDSQGSEKPVDTEGDSLVPLTLHFDIIEDSLGFGYDIFQGEQLMIHQPHIPAIQGNRGFGTSEEAQRVAELVIGKLEQGVMPPTVSLEELEALGVIDGAQVTDKEPQQSMENVVSPKVDTVVERRISHGKGKGN